MKRFITLFLFILTIGLLVACGKPAEQKQAEKIIKDISGPEATAAEMTTARGAYNKLKPEFEKLMAGKTTRLGKITGTGVNEKGHGRSWVFVFYSDTDDKNVEEIAFGWTRGKITSGSSPIMSFGLDTPDYDYMFIDIGQNWADSPDIAKQLYGASGGKEGVSKNGARMFLSSNTDVYADGSYWKADNGIPPTKPLYFDSKTGKQFEVK